MTADPDTAPLLSMRGIVKSYPGVQAVQGVDLVLHRGELLAVVGENGAGKSTLMKVLGGVVPPDGGKIRIDGRDVSFAGPHDAREAGIAMIHQEFTLVPGLTAVENIFLGQEPTRGGCIALSAERRRAKELFRRLGVAIDLDAPCGRLTTAQQQLVEIAKALAFEPRIVVLDEPTAALTAAEAGHLFGVIRELVARGIGAIFIGHRLEEIFALAHRVTVLRDGRNVADAAVDEFDRERLIASMVGRALADEYPRRESMPGPIRLEVRSLRRGRAVRDVSFTVRRGEIVAVTGLVGAGRTETARLIFAADRRDSGEILLDGRPVAIRSPRDAIAAGIGLLTEDRKREGLLLGRSARENFSLAILGRLSRAGLLDLAAEQRSFGGFIDRLRIRLAGQEVPARELSGGNQQKVVLARWLARDCDVLIFDEPTRGVDVGARHEIYSLMNELVAKGKSILMISSDLPEVLGMADRILVMHDGRITGELANGTDLTQEAIMRLAVA